MHQFRSLEVKAEDDTCRRKMAGYPILQKSGPRHSARLKELSNIVGALLRKHGFAHDDKRIQHGFERYVLAARGALAGKLTTDGLEPGKELEPADPNGALPRALHTGMLPEQIKLIVQLGLLIGEACHRWLHDANEHALFQWGAGVSRRWRVLSWPTCRIKA